MVYYIARMNDDGKWESLEKCKTYSEADEKIDDYCDKYPYALIEIVSSL
jgi:hypothetical protein